MVRSFMPRDSHVRFGLLGPTDRARILARHGLLQMRCDMEQNIHISKHHEQNTNRCDCENARRYRRMLAAKTALYHYIIGTGRDAKRWSVRRNLEPLP